MPFKLFLSNRLSTSCGRFSTKTSGIPIVLRVNQGEFRTACTKIFKYRCVSRAEPAANSKYYIVRQRVCNLYIYRPMLLLRRIQFVSRSHCSYGRVIWQLTTESLCETETKRRSFDVQVVASEFLERYVEVLFEVDRVERFRTRCVGHNPRYSSRDERHSFATHENTWSVGQSCPSTQI